MVVINNNRRAARIDIKYFMYSYFLFSRKRIGWKKSTTQIQQDEYAYSIHLWFYICFSDATFSK